MLTQRRNAFRGAAIPAQVSDYLQEARVSIIAPLCASGEASSGYGFLVHEDQILLGKGTQSLSVRIATSVTVLMA